MPTGLRLALNFFTPPRTESLDPEEAYVPSRHGHLEIELLELWLPVVARGPRQRRDREFPKLLLVDLRRISVGSYYIFLVPAHSFSILLSNPGSHFTFLSHSFTFVHFP